MMRNGFAPIIIVIAGLVLSFGFIAGNYAVTHIVDVTPSSSSEPSATPTNFNSPSPSFGSTITNVKVSPSVSPKSTTVSTATSVQVTSIETATSVTATGGYNYLGQ